MEQVQERHAPSDDPGDPVRHHSWPESGTSNLRAGLHSERRSAWQPSWFDNDVRRLSLPKRVHVRIAGIRRCDVVDPLSGNYRSRLIHLLVIEVVGQLRSHLTFTERKHGKGRSTGDTGAGETAPRNVAKGFKVLSRQDRAPSSPDRSRHLLLVAVLLDAR